MFVNTPSVSTDPTTERITTTSPDSLNKCSDFKSCFMRRNLTNSVKRLRQILNHWSLLVNSALNEIKHSFSTCGVWSRRGEVVSPLCSQTGDEQHNLSLAPDPTPPSPRYCLKKWVRESVQVFQLFWHICCN